MGGSLWALRILPRWRSGLIALTILIVRELGGGRYAQLLAGLCVLISPAMLVMDNFLSMNAFEPLFWMGCIWVVARILRTGDSRLWIWFGVLADWGWKISTPRCRWICGYGGAAADAASAEFARPWIWIAGAIAVALFLPNVCGKSASLSDD